MPLMSITLYFAPRSSATPIVWALAELGLDYEGVQVDLQAGEQKQPALMAHNPMGQVPTLVDGDHGMFESTAILVWLGERYGVERGLWPRLDSPEHMVALTWTSWFAVTLGATLRMVMLNTTDWWPEELRNAGQAEKGKERLAELMKILDERLGKQEYLVGDRFTLLDCYGASVLAWATSMVGFDLGTTPKIGAWIQRCMAREAAKSIQ
jgi:glutathione S-transferase